MTRRSIGIAAACAVAAVVILVGGWWALSDTDTQGLDPCLYRVVRALERSEGFKGRMVMEN